MRENEGGGTHNAAFYCFFFSLRTSWARSRLSNGRFWPRGPYFAHVCSTPMTASAPQLSTNTSNTLMTYPSLHSNDNNSVLGYRDPISHFKQWCMNFSVQLNVTKTKELLSLRAHTAKQNPTCINNETVSWHDCRCIDRMSALDLWIRNKILPLIHACLSGKPLTENLGLFYKWRTLLQKMKWHEENSAALFNWKRHGADMQWRTQAN